MGEAPPVLREALESLPEQGRSAFLEHLRGGTSANYLSDWLKRWGKPVSATTLKTYRRSIA